MPRSGDHSLVTCMRAAKQQSAARCIAMSQSGPRQHPFAFGGIAVRRLRFVEQAQGHAVGVLEVLQRQPFELCLDPAQGRVRLVALGEQRGEDAGDLAVPLGLAWRPAGEQLDRGTQGRNQEGDRNHRIE